MKKHFVIFGIGVVMIVTATLTLLKQETRAATNYTSTWTVDAWRNVSNPINVPSLGYNLSLGPARWKVTGQVGSTSFSETWEATLWKDTVSIGLVQSGAVSLRCVDIASLTTGSLTEASTNAVFRVAGYGGEVVLPSGRGTALCAFSSIPTSWTVTGTINN